MADIQISIHEASGALLPSVQKVEIVAGNTITFTSASEDCALHFSPDLLTILAPNESPSAVLAAGTQLVYSFTGIAPGVHLVILQAPANPAPDTFAPAAGAGQTQLIIRSGGLVPVDAPEPISLHATLEEVSFEPIADVHGIISNPLQT